MCGRSIFTAAGNYFSAGADVKERPSLSREPGDFPRHNRLTRDFSIRSPIAPRPRWLPSNGPALGAGVKLDASPAARSTLAADNAAVFDAPTRCRARRAAAGLSLTVPPPAAAEGASARIFINPLHPGVGIFTGSALFKPVRRADQSTPAALEIVREDRGQSPIATRLWSSARLQYGGGNVIAASYRPSLRPSVTGDLSLDTEDATRGSAGHSWSKREAVFKGR